MMGETSPVEELLRERSLLYVTGKGGSGKTTVAAALGIAAARRGRRTAVCELTGAAHLESSFAGPGGSVRRSPENLRFLSVEPREALREWMRRQPGGVVADAVLGRSQTFAGFVEAAPGAKELVTIGKVLALAGHAPVGAERTYDLVVADGPSTGHAIGMLAAPGGVGAMAPRGPVASQARALQEQLADRRVTGYVGVSLPEEMSVRELLDLERGLLDAVGRPLDLVVVNGVHPDRFTDEEAERMAALAAGSRACGALDAALREHRRARIHAGYVAWLRERAHAPVITLPYSFAAEIGPAEYALLADELTAAPRHAPSAMVPG
jgi:anion-transporting  ArsA/GET3 family ATPase